MRRGIEKRKKKKERVLEIKQQKNFRNEKKLRNIDIELRIYVYNNKLLYNK